LFIVTVIRVFPEFSKCDKSITWTLKFVNYFNLSTLSLFYFGGNHQTGRKSIKFSGVRIHRRKWDKFLRRLTRDDKYIPKWKIPNVLVLQSEIHGSCCLLDLSWPYVISISRQRWTHKNTFISKGNSVTAILTTKEPPPLFGDEIHAAAD